jgi:hypothetical protein
MIYPSCIKNKREEIAYPVEIKNIDNVLYINNPSTSKKEPKEFLLDEELSIGNDTDDNYIFGKVRKIALDSQENIYVLDSRRYCVKIFDKKGVFRRSVSRKGEGPGEIARPIDLVVDDKNKIISILDSKNMKIARYNFDGAFDSDLKLRDGNPDEFFLFQNSFYVVDYSYIGKEGDIKHKLIKYSYTGRNICHIIDFYNSLYQGQKKGEVTITFDTPFDPKVHFACSPKGYLFRGFSNKFEISIYDADLKKIMVFTKNKPERVKISNFEKEKFIEGLNEKFKKKGAEINMHSVKFPEFHPIFKNIWLDDQDRILVNSCITDDKAYIDVFNINGIYEEKMIITEPYDATLVWIFYKPIFIKRCVFSIIINKASVIMIKKYRIVKKKIAGNIPEK